VARDGSLEKVWLPTNEALAGVQGQCMATATLLLLLLPTPTQLLPLLLNKLQLLRAC
jgi:hypothetical protein